MSERGDGEPVSKTELLATLTSRGVTEATIRQVMTELDRATAAPSQPAAPAPRASRAATVTYYVGGLLVIGSMSVFLGQAWAAAGDEVGLALLSLYAVAFLGMAQFFRKRAAQLPAGFMATAAVALAPAIVFAFSKVTGLGEGTQYGNYEDFYVWVSSQWFAMELITIAVGIAVLKWIDFTLILAVLGTSLYFAAMDMAEVVFGNEVTDGQRAGTAVLLGVVGVAIGLRYDYLGRRRHGFWPHLFGLLSIVWGFEWLVFGAAEEDGVAWILTGVFGTTLLAVGTFLARRTYLVVGAVGVFTTMMWLSFTVFEDTLLLPPAIAVVGMSVIFLGIRIQRRTGEIRRGMLERAPAWLQRLSPSESDQARFIGAPDTAGSAESPMRNSVVRQ